MCTPPQPRAPSPAASAQPAQAPTPPPKPPAAVYNDSTGEFERKPWADFPATCEGAFGFFRARLEGRGEPYAPARHDGTWFDIYDRAAKGKDPDLLSPAEVEGLFAEIDAALPPGGR